MTEKKTENKKVVIIGSGASSVSTKLLDAMKKMLKDGGL